MQGKRTGYKLQNPMLEPGPSFELGTYFNEFPEKLSEKRMGSFARHGN
jgi:hypothetical protein